MAESSESDNTDSISSPLLQVAAGVTPIPDINLAGSGLGITNGDSSPRASDNTDFEGINVDSEEQRTFVIRNSGTGTLNFSGSRFQLSGANSNQFRVISDPGSSLTANSSGNLVISFRPTSSGLKSATVTINSNDEDTPSFTFSIQGTGISNSDDHGNGTADATTVGLSSTTAGIIDTVGDGDYFKIVVPFGGTLVVTTLGSMDTFGTLFDSTGFVIQEDDDTGDFKNFRVQSNLTAGTYFVRARGYNGEATGSYSLKVDFYVNVVADDHGDNNESASTLTVGTSTIGVLEQGGDVDVFKIELSSAGSFTVQSAGTTDADARLLDANSSEGSHKTVIAETISTFPSAEISLRGSTIFKFVEPVRQRLGVIPWIPVSPKPLPTMTMATLRRPLPLRFRRARRQGNLRSPETSTTSPSKPPQLVV